MFLLKLSITLVTIIGPLNVKAQDNSCLHTVTFLPQAHPVVTNSGIQIAPESLDEVAYSQYRIAKYIDNHRELPVFSEQAGTTFSAKGFSSVELQAFTKKYKDAFPEGLAKSVEFLNNEQKLLLVRSGGEAVMLMLGSIDTVFGTTATNQIQDKVMNDARLAMQDAKTGQIIVGSPSYKKIFDVRERLALAEINKYFLNNPTAKEAILVYGSLHDFRRHNDMFPSHCVTTPLNF